VTGGRKPRLAAASHSALTSADCRKLSKSAETRQGTAGEGRPDRDGHTHTLPQFSPECRTGGDWESVILGAQRCLVRDGR
jgi:hypothetical protein